MVPVPIRMRTAPRTGGCGCQHPGSLAWPPTLTSARSAHLDSDGIAASSSFIERLPAQPPLAGSATVLARIAPFVDFEAACTAGRKATPARVVAWADEVEVDVAERLDNRIVTRTIASKAWTTTSHRRVGLGPRSHQQGDGQTLEDLAEREDRLLGAGT